MKTALVSISDAEIKRQAANDEVGELRDLRYHGLRFRFLTDRSQGSWYIVRDGKWHKVSRYPALTTKAMIEAFPKVVARFADDPNATAEVATFEVIGDLLNWHLERQLRNRSLSERRKISLKSIIRARLLPYLGGTKVAGLSKGTLDQRIFWKMQSAYGPGYVRQAYGVLKAAMRQAARLDMIESNPMEHMLFTDFIQGKIQPKPAALRPAQVPDVVDALHNHACINPPEAMLAMMMLAHGTRLGETRKARWKHIRFEEKVWHIPADETKTRTVHELPLTATMLRLLTNYKAYQEARGGSAFLFPARPGKCLSEKQASEVFVVLGKGEWTSHDLRKLARTCWTELGVDHLIGELLLNHAMRGVTATYIQTDAVPRKLAALEKWHAHLVYAGFGGNFSKTDTRSHVSRECLQANAGAASSDISHP